VPEETADRFRLLFVCTGNICRSAAAERLARAGLIRRLGPGAPVDVSSAGTRGLVGEPMDPAALTALRAVGGDGDGFVARRLDARVTRDVDLVLTATREHRAAVVRIAPTLLRCTFTIREFDRLAGAVDPARLPRRANGVARMRAAVDDAASSRGMLGPTTPAADDVADPIGASPELHAAVVGQISAALERPLDLLAAAYSRPS
jgi:protein-tyrosine phosphatase